MPKDAPSFFRAAFDEARKSRRPLVIDFGASWCGPCKRLKTETLADPDVAKLLAKVQFVDVDVDEHPGLAKAYKVTAVPDVVFVDRDQYIVDRLGNFEPPVAFRARLQALIENTLGAPHRLADGEAATSASAEATDAEPELVSLSDSLAPLVKRFNADKGKVRFIALLSPT